MANFGREMKNQTAAGRNPQSNRYNPPAVCFLFTCFGFSRHPTPRLPTPYYHFQLIILSIVDFPSIVVHIRVVWLRLNLCSCQIDSYSISMVPFADRKFHSTKRRHHNPPSASWSHSSIVTRLIVLHCDVTSIFIYFTGLNHISNNKLYR